MIAQSLSANDSTTTDSLFPCKAIFKGRIGIMFSNEQVIKQNIRLVRCNQIENELSIYKAYSKSLEDSIFSISNSLLKVVSDIDRKNNKSLSLKNEQIDALKTSNEKLKGIIMSKKNTFIIVTSTITVSLGILAITFIALKYK